MAPNRSKGKKAPAHWYRNVKIPSFDESALSALTKSIELNLGKASASNTYIQAKCSTAKSEIPSSSVVSAALREREKSIGIGKKRDARGNVKKLAIYSSSSKEWVKDPNNEAGIKGENALLNEILTLGGTEEDLDLIGELSDGDELSEEVSPKVVRPRFSKDLSKFVTELGIEGLQNGDSNTTGPGDEQDDETIGLLTDAVIAASAPSKAANKNKLRAGKGLEKNENIRKHFILETRPDWHAAPLQDLPQLEEANKIAHRGIVLELKRHAYALLEYDSDLYASRNLSSTSSHRFLSTIMTSGTLSDKVSALTLIIQESPVHTIKSFESLLALAGKRSRGQAVTALGAIKDLLAAGSLLPPDRRLRFFEHQPGLLGTLRTDLLTAWKAGDALPGQMTNMHIAYWAYEDWLKNTYFEVLQILEEWCNDEVEFARGRAVTYVYELLREKPEQESNLLRLLVNKLGDTDRKIASRTSFMILQLQAAHPLMKSIIIRAIESELLLRPGQGSHAKYYAINTLNQTILDPKDCDVARKLLSIYFDLFVNLLKKPVSPKPAAGVPINRKGQVQGGGGAKGKKAMEKAKQEERAKRLSEEAKEKMISSILTGVNRALPFSSSDDSSLQKHMDMLFKITHSSNFNTSIQALMLIQQLVASKQFGEERFYRTLYESLFDPRLITSSKHVMFLNLLSRALKSDLNVKRVKAFAKRLLQVTTLHQPPFICGVIFLLKDLEKTFPGLRSLLSDPEDWEEFNEEVFLDVADSVQGEPSVVDSQTIEHASSDGALNGELTQHCHYDGRKRDPEHSRAENSCLWELLPFLTHFHPSVSILASHLLYDNDMPAKPDLASHTLIHFLDRFAYKTAKATASGLRGSSIMQPLAGEESQTLFVSSRLLQHDQEPLNSDAFWRRRAKDVAVDEVFFHKYFSRIGKRKQLTGRDSIMMRETTKSSVEENEYDEDGNEDEIWQTLIESRPEIEGQSDEGGEFDMRDLDDSEEGSEVGDSDDLEGELDVSDAEDGDNSQQDDTYSSAEEHPLSNLDKLFSEELRASELSQDFASKKKTSRERKKKLKSLPTFAPTEQYLDMLSNDDDEDF